MKVQKKDHKKVIITMALSVACVGILVGCFLLSRDRTPEFSPVPPLPSETPSSWEENRSDQGSGGSTVNPSVSGQVPEEYPKATPDADGNVDIQFTPPGEALKPEPPEPPQTNADNTNPSAPPTYTPEQVKPPEDKTPPADEKPTDAGKPAPGSKRSDGAVYDPVFGWIVPGQVQQTPIDSDGDPNKQVGNMGP